ncbi:uncharacterized protein E5676_scaffold232G001530 [Cucumis melo var. makuwa]|uniref:Reverse transcriptase n=1 Tax=Cucumis melo var. makuwa TaxID=1194695 RepID=A0A5D3BF82_CUCMM|nr:uncharacterized protein E5676_scaffold232G001530 [Cucumis melo var. makuwa]
MKRHQSSSPGRNRNSRPSPPKVVGGDKRSGKDRRPYQSTTENTWQRSNNRSPPKRPLSCFICEGPHLARECPNKVDFYAFQASLISDSDDKSNQAEGEVGQIDGGEKTRIGAIKYMLSLQKKSGERHVPTKRGLLGRGQTFKTSLGEGFRKNEGREFHCPTYRRTSETNNDKAGRMERPNRLVVVKMDDFDVVLGMEFLFEHQVIPMPSARCLVIIGSFPTIVQADIRQPNGFRMISAMQLNKNRIQQEPPSLEIPLGALGKMKETIPKDTLCVPKKCHDVMPNSWPKSLSMRRRIDHGIESSSEKLVDPYKLHREPVLSLKKKDRSLRLCIDRCIQNKLTVRRTYPFPLLLNLFDRSRGVKYFLKLNIRSRYYRVRATKAEGLETTCVTGLREYEFPVVPFSLTNAKEGKCCSMQGQINVLDHVVEFHQIEMEKKKIVATFHEGILNKSKLADGVDDQAADPRRNNVVRLSINLKQEEDREVKEVLADRVRTNRRPTREIHKFLVKWKNTLVEATSREHVEDLEAWKQKIRDLQLRQLTGTSTV